MSPRLALAARSGLSLSSRITWIEGKENHISFPNCDNQSDCIWAAIAYLDGLALQQGEVKGRSIEEGLAFKTLECPQAAGGVLAQKLGMETWVDCEMKLNQTLELDDDA